MRFLLSTIGTRGDVQPLVALAVELRGLGHEAHLCVPPDFREWVEGLGFPVTAVGPLLRTAAAAPSEGAAPPSPEQMDRLARGLVTAQFETISKAAEGCDAVVAATALQVAARSVAEVKGIPYVFVAYCPAVVPSPHHLPPFMPGRPSDEVGNRALWEWDAARFKMSFGGALDAHRASLGLPPVGEDVRGHILTDRPWLAADPALAPWPGPEGGVVQTGAWVLPDERPLPAELEEFLAAGEPPVYLGLGSRMHASQDLVEAAVGAARALGRRVIVSRGWSDLSAADDADCLTIGDVDHGKLFGRVAAVVHHGGAGTTTAAARAGTPQVVLPEAYDQFYWARLLEDLGIGAGHPLVAPTADSLAGVLEQALHPDTAARAKAIAPGMRTDGARLAARRLIAMDL